MKIGLGTVQFGLDYGISNAEGKTPLNEVQKILAIAKHYKIRVVDTATMYGTSEAILGKALQGKGEFDIVTKTPRFHEIRTADRPALLEKMFQRSLKNMQCSNVYGLLIHNADDVLGDGGNLLLEKMQELRAQGVVRKIGVSVYTEEQIDKILERFDIDLIQLPVNVLDQRLILSGHLARLKKSGIEIHARSVFLQGLLLMEPTNLPVYFGSIRTLLIKYHENLRHSSMTPVQAALSFVAGLDDIDVVVCGVNDHEQLTEICNSVRHVETAKFSEFAISDENILNPSKWKN